MKVMHCDVFGTARRELPPAFSVQEVANLLPGVIAPGTVYNHLSRGDGPPHQKIGRRVILERDTFLNWVQNRHAKNGLEVA